MWNTGNISVSELKIGLKAVGKNGETYLISDESGSENPNKLNPVVILELFDGRVARQSFKTVLALNDWLDTHNVKWRLKNASRK